MIERPSALKRSVGAGYRRQYAQLQTPSGLSQVFNQSALAEASWRDSRNVAAICETSQHCLGITLRTNGVFTNVVGIRLILPSNRNLCWLQVNRLPSQNR